MSETILEHKLISSYKNEMISFFNSHHEFFEEAIELAVSDKKPYSWRAAWLLWSCLEENDKRVRKHISKIVDGIKGKKDGHQRELLKILYFMELKKEHEGKLFNICMNIWEQINKDPSVRLTALKFLFKIVMRYPKLSKEIDFLTQEHYLKALSPGVRKSISKMITEFNKGQKLIGVNKIS